MANETSSIRVPLPHKNPLCTAVSGKITDDEWALPLRRWAATALFGQEYTENSQTATSMV